MVILSRRAAMILNFVGFQAAWFATVLGAANSRHLLGPMVTAAVLVIHLALRRRPVREFGMILNAACLGTILDLVQRHFGLIAFAPAPERIDLFALWLIALWANFAGTLNGSMAWLHGRPLLAAISGAIAGPLAYFAGVRLGALEFHPDAWRSFLSLGIEWAVAMPILMIAAGRFGDRSVGRAEDDKPQEQVS